MKKGIVIGIVIAMLGWAVYDMLVDKGDSGASGNGEKEPQMRVAGDGEGLEGDKASENEDVAGGEVGLQKGQKAPDFELQTMEGETVKLSDYRGQKVMINFWATWCPPCRAEMPDMQKFYENEDIEILAVNLTQTESDASDVTEFVDDFGLTFPILMDEKIAVANQYEIKPIPTSYFVDSEGYIQYVALGAMNYDLMLQQYEQMD
ncbi:thiol:disulfide interchange protein tlpA [Thalassobacillus devorans]|uniref:Thiol:disulfide interchange protein tlpA n=1 Tax=Thalassobacillus devorans TaxID=279813 RepID=A0ABQ1PCH6_9BACI|nr:TlpA disulfide reductase family protein [Thalassobacillus devorans]NIK29154.1 peroxiredoxin [Thalassobacillus devorans]GGC94499.1 thiol:disulfide interchange protein tlpA [Thalassobacillus devorans]